MAIQGDVEISARDCLRKEASDYEKEVVAALTQLEKVLQKAPDYPEIMRDQEFWATLYANLIDITGSVKEFIKPTTKIKPKKKVWTPYNGNPKLMLPPNCS